MNDASAPAIHMAASVVRTGGIANDAGGASSF
jgi:hypothetical protein